MRILLTVHQFFPEFLSGTEVITLQTARELRRRGHEVRILTGFPWKGSPPAATPGAGAAAGLPDEDAARFDSYTYDGFTVERFLHSYAPMGEGEGRQSNVMELEYRNELFRRWFSASLARWRPEIIHFFHLARLSTTAIDAAREARIPTVFTATDFWFVCPLIHLRLADGSLCAGPDAGAVNCIRHIAQTQMGGVVGFAARAVPRSLAGVGISLLRSRAAPPVRLKKYVRAMSARPAHMAAKLDEIDRVIVPSRIARDLLQRHGLNPSRMICLPYGIQLEDIQRQEDKGEHAALRIGYIGTLVEHKGAHVLIEAFRHMPPDLPATLRLYGKPEEFPAYTQRLRKLAAGDGRISFMGTFAPVDMGKIFADFDVLVVPSLWYENTPMVIYAAQASGTPVVASDLGGMSEAIAGGHDGLLVPPEDPAALASTLLRLSRDRPFLRELARNAPQPMSVAQNVDVLERLYAELIHFSPAAEQP